MEDHIRTISQHNGIPHAHLESGFEPAVIYDIGACVLHWTQEAKKLWPDAFDQAEL